MSVLVVQKAESTSEAGSGIRLALSALGFGCLLALAVPRPMHCEAVPATDPPSVENKTTFAWSLPEYARLSLHFWEHRAQKLESQELLSRSVKELETMSVVSALFVSLAFAVLSNAGGATLASSGFGGGTRLAVWSFLGINAGIFSVMLSTVLQFQLNGCLGRDVNDAVQDWNMILNANVLAFCASPFCTCMAVGQYYGAHYGAAAGALATGLVLSSLSILVCFLLWCGMRTWVSINKHADLGGRERT